MQDVSKRQDFSERDKARERCRNDFKAGKTVARDELVDAVGCEWANGWWNMIGPVEEPLPSARGLKPGEAVRRALDDLPAAVRQAHADDFNAGRHGLRLADEPAAVLVFRYDRGPHEGKIGVLIGHSALS